MATEKLTVDKLQTAEAVFTLGLLTVKSLQEDGMVTLFVSKTGEIEICPSSEIPLDGLSEDQALERLLSRGYSDEQLATYLKGREARVMQESLDE